MEDAQQGNAEAQAALGATDTNTEVKGQDAPAEALTEGASIVPDNKDEADLTSDPSDEEDRQEEKDADEEVSEEVDYSDLEWDAELGLGEDVRERTIEFAKELKLSKDQAQAFAKMYEEEYQAHSEENQRRLKETQESWVKQLKDDKDFGGPKYKETLNRAKATVKTAPEGFVKLLVDTGLQYHPDVVKHLASVNISISEAQSLEGKGTPREKSLAERLYPSMQK